MSESVAPTLAVPAELIERRIYLIRSHKVMLDADLAGLFQVPTKGLNQAVRRNPDRFPEDFMFQLTSEEVEILGWPPLPSLRLHRARGDEIWRTLDSLVAPPLTPKRQIGFNPDTPEEYAPSRPARTKVPGAVGR